MGQDPAAAITRRDLLRTGAAALALGSAGAAGASPAPKLGSGATILFQGDSITDAGRNRDAEGDANRYDALGHGYPMLLAHALLRDYAAQDLRIYNRGISGNRVPSLAERWQKDCIDLQPEVLSILVGVNDIWHKLNGDYDGTVADYEEGFGALLARTRRALPDVTMVVCEPFALRTGAVGDHWFPEMDERRAAAKRVADAAGATWVPFQSVFDKAIAKGTSPAYWAGDGVHPSMAGHALMAKAWRHASGL